jgi:hypothetical protein
MTNPAKQKGTAWESALVQAFRDEFGNCERLALNGSLDEGDLWFTHDGHSFVIEAKNERAIDLARYVTEAEAEADNWAKSRKAKTPFWAAIVKRRNHRVSKAYVVMTVDEFVRLVRR